MSFEYGSREINVSNPHRLAGLFELVRGALVALSGALLAFSVRVDVVGDAEPIVWLRFGLGIAMLIAGLTSLGRGAFRALRFYVGASVPSDLAPTRSQRGIPRYTGPSLRDMMLERKNPTFLEPRGLIERTLHGLFPQLLWMPPPPRAATLRLAQALVASTLLFFLWGLVVFSGSAGLTRISVSSVGSYLPAIAVLILLGVWLRAKQPPSIGALGSGLPISVRLGLLIGGAMIAPVVVTRTGLDAHIPPLTLTGFGTAVIVVLILAGVTTGLGALLLALRIHRRSAETDVAEFRDHWQENIHPSDIFRGFDHIMAEFRVLERPNRVYQELDPTLLGEGSKDKGSFSGTIMMETQPEPVQERPRAGDLVADATALLGEALGAAGWLWIATSLARTTVVSAQAVVDAFLLPVLFFVFGSVLGRLARIYRSEVYFQSQFVYFFAEGTFTESKLSTGMSIYDSNRSENVVVRANVTPLFLSSRLFTSTFSVPGPQNLEGLRFVLSMERNEGFNKDVIARLRKYVDSRRVITELRSEDDLYTAGAYSQMNQMAASRLAAPVRPTPQAPDPARPRVPGPKNEEDDAATLLEIDVKPGS